MTAVIEEDTRRTRASEAMTIRIGRCRAVSQRHPGGHCDCELYMLDQIADKFPVCECGHSQWVHERAGAPGEVVPVE